MSGEKIHTNAERRTPVNFQQVSRPTIYRWAETAAIHARRGPGGAHMVCRDSIVNPDASVAACLEM